MLDPILLFERAATGAATMVGSVRPQHRRLATPCTEWDVGALLAHMAGGTAYLLDGLGRASGPVATDEETYRAAVVRCVDALHEAGATDRRCMSPAGFEWSLGEAAAATAMDQLIHTWDLATAIGSDATLEAELVDACVALFLPHMPEVGRAAGLVGPEVPVPPDAPAQHRLLGAMGRRP